MTKIGLQVYDAAGNIILDYTDRVFNIYGSFYTSGANGYVENVNVTVNTKFIIAASDIQTRESNDGYDIDSPNIYIENGKIGWRINSSGKYYARWLVLFGN